MKKNIAESLSDFEYDLHMDGTITVTSLKKSKADIIVLPDCTVSIGKNAFRGQPFSKAVLPDGILLIDDSAFEGCIRLHTVELPHSLEYIGKDAFKDCLSLTRPYIHMNTELDKNAFDPDSADDGATATKGFILEPLKNGTYELIGIKEDCFGKTVRIPHCVSRIGDKAFYGQSTFEEILIPNSVSYVGAYAFTGCSSLASLAIPDSVTEIGEYAFSECTSLTDVFLPSGLSVIESGVFSCCPSLKSLNISQNAVSIGESAFGECLALSEVTLPSGLLSIADNAFSGCCSLREIYLPESISSLGFTVFDDCTKLETIHCQALLPQDDWDEFWNDGCDAEVLFGASPITDEITEAVEQVLPIPLFTVESKADKTLEITALNDKTAVRIALPEETVSIAPEAFKDCGFLHVTFPDGVKEIPASAFEGCRRLRTVSLPKNLHTVATRAFFNCIALEEPRIPSTVQRIEFGAFGNCAKLHCSYFSPDATVDPEAFIGTAWDERNNRSLLKQFSYTQLTDGTYAINSVGNAFKRKQEITIPTNVSRLSFSAFFACREITSVTIPGSVTSIAPNCFSECQMLGSITVSENNPVYKSANGALLSRDGERLFFCPPNVISFTVPNGVKIIEPGAFRACKKLKRILLPQGLERIEADAFSTCVLLSDLTLPDSVAHIGASAFSFCRSLTGIHLPSSLITLGESAFNACSQLSEVIFPDSIEKIGEKAFNSCPRLSSFEISESCKNYSTVDGVLFNKDKTVLIACPQSKKGRYVAPRELKTVSGWAFYDCRSITSVSLPDTVTSIGVCAFMGCSSLRTFKIPKGMTSVADYTFAWCSDLRTVTVSNMLQAIGQSAFSSCEKLSAFVFPDGIESIGKDAFKSCTAITELVFPSSLRSIDEGAFSSCYALSSVILENGLEALKRKAFAHCSALTKIFLPATLITVKRDVFYGCSHLRSIRSAHEAQPDTWEPLWNENCPAKVRWGSAPIKRHTDK
ncbi:MAG: leucine-rich repeat domain-containing protein [Clostridia bacterium]|nr:leucine-rich repeat domain-containing protein [Clostridia bacterium]